MNKLIIVIASLLFCSSSLAAEWKSNCPKAPDGCQNIGKTAYNNAHWLKPGKIRDNMESVPLGEITGVIWRPAGSLISYSPERTAKTDSWFYIVQSNDTAHQFLKKIRDTNPK